MISMFFYGTLRNLSLLDVVLDGEDFTTRPAVLADHSVCNVLGQAFPIIEKKVSASAQGILVEGLSASAKARLDFYEGGFDYCVQEMTVMPSAGDPTLALVFFPTPDVWVAGSAWDLEAWNTEWGDITLEAAREAMSYFGTISPKTLAGRFGMIRSRAASRVRGRASRVATRLRSNMGAGDVEVFSDTRPYSNFFTMQEQDLSFRRFNGEMSETVNRAAFIGGDAVIVLPYDPKRDRVMLIEQFRMGPHMRADPHPWMLEPIAGRVDAGESPEDCAHREAQEETGLTLSKLYELPSHYPSPGASSEYFYSYLALCDLTDSAAGISGLDHEVEDIRSHIISYDRLIELMDQKEITNGPLLMCILWLSQKRDQFRAEC
jgi:nudix-type nucleoside diphosphatase (YffH/AdpP family)